MKTLAKTAGGFEVVWTQHAAKRMVQRQFDPDQVMEAIALLCASGQLLPDKRLSITHGKIKVVATRRDTHNGRPVNPPRCILITVTHKRAGQHLPRNRRSRKGRR